MPASHNPLPPSPSFPPDSVAISFIFFDLDGTLTDPAVGITRCFAHALHGLGRAVPSEDVLRSFIGPPLQVTLAEIIANDSSRSDGMVTNEETAAFVERGVAFFRERFAMVGIYENEMYPYIADALASLKAAGFTLYIATSKPTVYAVEILRHFGLAGYFKAVYGSEPSGERIDKGEVIAHLMHTENLPAAMCLMVGDRKHDIVGAKQNALRATVGVTYGYGSVEELRTAGAKRVCARPEALAGILLRLACTESTEGNSEWI